MHKSDDDEYSQDIDPLAGVNNPFIDPFMQADPKNCRFRDYSNSITTRGFVLDFSDLEDLDALCLHKGVKKGEVMGLACNCPKCIVT